VSSVGAAFFVRGYSSRCKSARSTRESVASELGDLLTPPPTLDSTLLPSPQISSQVTSEPIFILHLCKLHLMSLEEDLDNLFVDIFWKPIFGKLSDFTNSQQQPGFIYSILRILTTLFAVFGLFAFLQVLVLRANRPSRSWVCNNACICCQRRS
jgi:hypothetical protein